jgi:hypothetical protein
MTREELIDLMADHVRIGNQIWGQLLQKHGGLDPLVGEYASGLQKIRNTLNALRENLPIVDCVQLGGMGDVWHVLGRSNKTVCEQDVPITYRLPIHRVATCEQCKAILWGRIEHSEEK